MKLDGEEAGRQCGVDTTTDVCNLLDLLYRPHPASTDVFVANFGAKNEFLLFKFVKHFCFLDFEHHQPARCLRMKHIA